MRAKDEIKARDEINRLVKLAQTSYYHGSNSTARPKSVVTNDINGNLAQALGTHGIGALGNPPSRFGKLLERIAAGNTPRSNYFVDKSWPNLDGRKKTNPYFGSRRHFIDTERGR